MIVRKVRIKKGQVLLVRCQAKIRFGCNLTSYEYQLETKLAASWLPVLFLFLVKIKRLGDTKPELGIEVEIVVPGEELMGA